MIIRVQSSFGTKRLEISDSDHISKLVNLTSEAFNVDINNDWCLSKTRNINDAFKGTTRKLIKSAKLKHGDLLFLLPKSLTNINQYTEQVDFPVQNRTSDKIREDEVDGVLDAKDGRIMRPKNAQFCHHADNGQCIHCLPLEPSDPEYLSQCVPPVKFMSFHAYVRKLRGGRSKGKFVRLENLDCTVRRGCTDHPSWPDGICTKCQPKPVTLDIQTYRHIDFVQFENAQIIETFLDYWRSTGKQRIGILLGRYTPFETPGAPPLAIKSVVVAIYEPPQEATNREVKLLCSLTQLLPSSALSTATNLGLRVIGWIFTDLTPDDSTQGTVQHYRGSAETFFMSAQECITAARLQNLHPNVSVYSSDGHFGSKFVTVVATGGSNNQIHFHGYQVSNVAMALEKANMLVPTYDAPELGYIRETTDKQFVPDVFYSSKDEYGNIVTRVGRPLPIEYLLVDMPAAFPIEQAFTFADQSSLKLIADKKFPVENRADLGQEQNFDVFSRYCHTIGLQNPRACLSNFHVLIWLADESNLPLGSSTDSSEGLSGLLEAVKSDAYYTGSNSDSKIHQWAESSSIWATTRLMMETLREGGSPLPATLGESKPSFRDAAIGLNPFSLLATEDPANQIEENQWTCHHCTFNNQMHSEECEICGLPHIN